MRKTAGILLALAVLLSAALMLPSPARAASATDEIKNFTITVDVNEDASLNMVYHIEWTVLDDVQYGKLEWVDIGLPNSNHSEPEGLTDTVDRIEDKGSSANIYLDRAYAAGETVTFEFSFTQENLYQVDRYTAGETVYAFTPAWFDGIAVDSLTIRWNADKATAWQPDCLQDNGYLVFTGSLKQGEKFKVSVTYPNDAFGFTAASQESGSSGSASWSDSGDSEDTLYTVIAVVFFLGALAIPVFVIVKLVKLIGRGCGFGSSAESQKKITRTKIEYYESCPHCGAGREEGKENCAYCGSSMVKSKEVVEEKDIEQPEKYTLAGTYRYGSSPNTFIHVNVVDVPVHRPTGSSGRSGGGSSRSPCASHSSCASSCACASHCACACACASSGRAGCSVKGFFSEKLHEGRIVVESRRKKPEAPAEEKA